MLDGDLFEGLRNGDRAALGKAITLIESDRAVDASRIHALVEACLPFGGKAMRIGITGIPGVGKSTLIDALGSWMIEKGHRVAVLAIDPSSERSGGSILGDKTRMERLSVRPEAFIRPTPAAGNTGGIARRTREAIALCEAAGYDRILVETVGTGQNELEVDHITDLNVLLLIAGAGDELQGIKRGIMEAADLIAFTKADGSGRERAEHARRDLQGAISLLPPRGSGRRPDLLLTSATSGEGVDALGEALNDLFESDRASGYLDVKRRDQLVHWLGRTIDRGLRRVFDQDPRIIDRSPDIRDAVRNGTKSPFAAAEELLRLFRTSGAPRP